MKGILLVDKPAGWTSHDAVAKVRAIIKQGTGLRIKVGHSGTLDPAATGLLVLLVGSYTKRAGEFSKLDKTYEAELTLGAVSTTGDIEGKIIPKSTIQPSEGQVRTVLGLFEGQIEQTPPPYSAIKIGGQRAYKLARRGKTPELKPRKIQIYSIQLTDYSYPKVKVAAKVSSGTYIRSLTEDIGKKLNTGAYLSALRRSGVGKFNVDGAIIANELAFDNLSQHLAKQKEIC